LDPLSARPLPREHLRGSIATSLYVHLPFCDVRCPYCHFHCFVNRDPELPLRYVRALASELEIWEGRGISVSGLRSIYFGGGTPSALAPEARAWLCAWLAEELKPRLTANAEITVEVNPESAWPEVLRDWTDAGVNRISVGVQSMDSAVLAFLGRLNTPASSRRALELACSLVDRVSADLLVASPADDASAILDSIHQILRHPVQHISAYLLEIHPETRFGRDVVAGRWKPQPDARQEALYLRLVQELEGRGLIAYELSNFARPGHESQHNRGYWSREPYLGLGSSAHSYVGDCRWANLADAGRYCRVIEGGEPALQFVEPLGEEQIRAERILLGLRTRHGIPKEWLGPRATLCEELANAGLLRIGDVQVAATPRGWLVLDEIAARLVD
jgi:oxygen-independent coproporphyrinogen-3 oxidase